MINPRTLLVSIVVLFSACGDADQAVNSDDMTAAEVGNLLVVTSNYPLKFLAGRVAEGVAAAPKIVLPDIDGDPASWGPSAEQIQLLQSADVVILNGAGAEPWLDLMSIDQRRLLDTSANIRDRLIPLEGAVEHQHGPEGDHSHEGMAFTTWLDPQLAIAQSQALTDGLVKLAPTGEAKFRVNMTRLEEELTQLDTRLAEVFAKLDGRPILFSHPVYQYLQRRYGINGESVHWEPDEVPTTAAWIAMQQMIAGHHATIMIWEDEPLQSTAQRLSATGITSVVWYTAANNPEQGDYLSVMQGNAERLESFLAHTDSGKK
jgi:zinc transport system substrate-binding protein